ncbi:conserved hypothetical protein [Ricinus communis]|uniref:RNase H type-1 domain-containing protein n=1 Tax=Ricinus communis TaxID=3988 RepID=B9RVI3_RICCO|nr:conserved hypothetical protein [Ricinus communis]
MYMFQVMMVLCRLHGSPLRFIKLNSDATFDYKRGVVGIAVVARDDRGNLVDSCSRVVPASSPLVAEALALLDATIFASSKKFLNCIFETDCLVLANSFIVGASIFSEIDPIISAILDKFKALGSHSVVHISRTCNQAADWVASTTLSGSLGNRNIVVKRGKESK